MTITLVHGACEDKMWDIPPGTIDMVITSPPYNVDKDYGIYNDNKKMIDYKKYLRDIFRRCWILLKSDGRIAVNVANLGRKPYIHLSGIITEILKDVGFKIWSEIIWNKNSPDNNVAFSGSIAWGSWLSASCPSQRDSHEYIIIAVKDSYSKFNKGISTITKEEFMKWTLGIWNFPGASDRHHPCVFPEELPRRLIKLYTYEGDIVLDPFSGRGTTVKVADELGRHGYGIEINEEFHNYATSNVRPNSDPLDY